MASGVAWERECLVKQEAEGISETFSVAAPDLTSKNNCCQSVLLLVCSALYYILHCINIVWQEGKGAAEQVEHCLWKGKEGQTCILVLLPRILYCFIKFNKKTAEWGIWMGSGLVTAAGLCLFHILFLLLHFEDERPCRKQSVINSLVISSLLGEGGIWQAFQVFKNVGDHHQISNTQWDQSEKEGWKNIYKVFYEWCALGVYSFKQCTCSIAN